MNKSKLKILFFYVHPAKFHLFKNAIKLLEKGGHHVDIVISNKEVLSDLLQTANVKFTNLFPKGRKISFLSSKVNAFIGLIRTIWKLWIFSRKKNYDIYVTDDVLSILGKIQRIPSIAFTDNDLSTVPLIKLIFKSATKIVAPSSTYLDELEYKKIPFKGNKAVAHLSPKYFKKDEGVLIKNKLLDKQIVIIRLAKLNANHDLKGNPGITDDDLDVLIDLIPKHKTIIISAERLIPHKFQKYKYNIAPQDFTQILANASFFIGDSGTMATEAAILGVPNILINNVAKKCGVHVELNEVYNLQYYFDNFSQSIETINSLINNEKNIHDFRKRRDLFVHDSDDFNMILFNSIITHSKSNENKVQ